MNPRKQLLALVKFQALSNRPLWYIPVFFSPLAIISIWGADLDLDSAISNVAFLILLLPGMILLTPQSSYAAANQSTGNATEFLITRATDRNILYRSKAIILYLIALAIPVALLFVSLKNPDLHVTLNSQISPELCFSHVPGSTLVPSKTEQSQPQVFIPAGNVLIAGWHIWALLAGALAMQLLFLIRFKGPGWLKDSPIFWRLVFIGVWMCLILLFLGIVVDAAHSANNHLFFSFAAHQTLFWILTAFIVIPGHLWCERRFARLEQ